MRDLERRATQIKETDSGTQGSVVQTGLLEKHSEDKGNSLTVDFSLWCMKTETALKIF